MKSRMKAQASMIDVLLLGLLVSIVLIAGIVFIGSEQLRAQQARTDSIYAQTQLLTLLNYRNQTWNNATAAAMIADAVCNIGVNETPNCDYNYANENEKFYWVLQNALNLTRRADYNYIFYAIDDYGQDFTICDRQLKVCGQNLPGQAKTAHSITCPSDSALGGNSITIYYAFGIWPSYQNLPEDCP